VGSFKDQETRNVVGSSQGVEPSRLGWAIAACCWIYLLIVFTAWMALRAGDLWWPATLLLFSPRWLLAIPLLPLALAALCWRRRSLIVVLLALVLVLGSIMNFNIPWHTAVSAAPSGMRLRVLTCNMHYGQPEGPTLERLLTETNPDVVAIQELRREPFDFFAGKQWHIHHRTGGHFLASRYPIRQTEHLGYQSMTVPGSLMRYELETPTGPLILFSLHFASPRESLNETVHLPETGFVELEDNSAVRWQQSENLLRLVEKTTDPVLLVGDFNTPPESAIFRRIWDRYTDAFTAAGWGWGYTFFNKRTMVRIDHILAGPGWYCERCWVGPNIGSPHHPLLADLILVQP